MEKFFENLIDSENFAFIFIILCSSIVVIIPWIIYHQFFSPENYEKAKKRIKVDLDNYLKEQNFNFELENKYKLLVECAQKDFVKSTKELKYLNLFCIFACALTYYLTTDIAIRIIMVIAAIVIIFFGQIAVLKFSRFNKQSLDEYDCPKCKQKICWFIEKIYDDEEQYYTTHERREETDSKGHIHIVYAPVDRAKFKRHTIYRCNRCHHEEETTKELNYRIN